ncbi:MAG TPA: alpha/beta fold hydrolase [Candidatus Binatia bacterium]|nr:alpha/beta fold hydrolase [Candidatus Binatia bacterium]
MNKSLFLFLTLTVSIFAQGAQTNANGILEEEVGFSRGDALYSGTLSRPAGPGASPLLIMVSGMGPQDRDWNFGKNYKLAKIVADYLTQNGIAVYRYDDRGFGKSTGTAETLTGFDDLAEDVYSAVTTLKSRKDIGKIGLFGHSLGGILSIMAAAKHPDIDFVITLSGSYQNGGDIMMEQAHTLKRWKTAEDMSEEQVIANGEKFVQSWISYSKGGSGLETMKQILGELIRYQIKKISPEKMAENLKTFKDADDLFEKSYADAIAFYTSPHQRSFAVYDPAEDVKKLACPVLVLFGEKDRHVVVKSNLPKLAQALATASVTDLTIKIIPGVDHGYTTPELYKKAEVGPGVLEFIANWVNFRR